MVIFVKICIAVYIIGYLLKIAMTFEKIIRIAKKLDKKPSKSGFFEMLYKIFCIFLYTAIWFFVWWAMDTSDKAIEKSLSKQKSIPNE